MIRTRWVRMGLLAVLIGVAAGCCGDRPRLFDRFRGNSTSNSELILMQSPDGCSSCNNGCDSFGTPGIMTSGPIIMPSQGFQPTPGFQGTPGFQQGPMIQNTPQGPTELLPVPNIPPTTLQENPARVTPADPQKNSGNNLNKTVTQNKWFN